MRTKSLLEVQFLAPLKLGISGNADHLGGSSPYIWHLNPMANSTVPFSRAATAGVSGQAGSKLRRIRERLNLTLRAVEEASAEIAAMEHNSEYFVSVGRLNQIENDGSLPSIFKLYSLATVYHIALEDAAALY